MSKKLQSEVGDKRTVRSDLIHDEYYGDEVTFDEGMKKFLGQEVIITGLYLDGSWCNVKNGEGWSFSEEMFEPIEIKVENYHLRSFIERANKELKGNNLVENFCFFVQLYPFSPSTDGKRIYLRSFGLEMRVWDSMTDDPINSFEDFSEMMYGRINELKSQLSQVYRLTEWRK